MKLVKKLGVAAIALSMATLGLTSCTSSGDETIRIVIGVQQTQGNNYEAMCNFLDDIKDDLGFEYETTLLESRNNDKNLTTFQTKMLTGIHGIISMVDMDSANMSKLLEECEKNDVYYAGYMSDFANSNQNEEIMGSKYMLGSVSDGEIDGAVRGEFLFNAIVESDDRNVVFARFPLYAYPSAAQSIAKFKELALAYNETHDDDFTFYSEAGNENADTYEVSFTESQIPDAQITKWNNAGVDAVVSVNSLAKRILPGIKSANLDNTISIYSTGWEDNIIDDFGDDKCIKTLAQTPAETIIYPLVRILNAARGNEYSDEPAWNEKIVTGRYVYISSTQDLADGRENCMNFSLDKDPSRALISKEDLKALLAGEDGAIFAKLVETLNSWDSEYVLRRK